MKNIGEQISVMIDGKHKNLTLVELEHIYNEWKKHLEWIETCKSSGRELGKVFWYNNRINYIVGLPNNINPIEFMDNLPTNMWGEEHE